MIEQNFITTAILSFLMTVLFIIVLKPLAIRFQLTDKPCARKHHDGHIPLIGGIAIFLSIMFVMISDNLLSEHLMAYMFASVLLIGIGIFDDFKSINTLSRFLVQITAVMIMIEFGHVEIKSFGNLLGGGDIQLGQWSKVVTVFAVVGGINAFNMIDGMDGLAGSLSLIIFIILAILGSNEVIYLELTFLCILFIGATLAFLIFNSRIFLQKASVFLGDTGSTWIGFSVCWVAIALSQGDNKVIEPVTVLWIIALPIMDTVAIMIRRIYNKRSPFSPDREHLHHIFTAAGYSFNATVSIIILVSTFLAMIGLLALYANIVSYLVFYVFLGFFGLYYWGMCRAWAVMKLAKKLRTQKNPENQLGYK